MKSHYTPILKAKSGEFKALKKLKIETRENLTPLFEIPPITYDYVNGKPSKTIEKHLQTIINGISGTGRRQYPCYIDVELLDEIKIGDKYILFALLESLREKREFPIPVIRLHFDNGYLIELKNEIQNNSKRICVRLTQDDFEDFDLQVEIERIIEVLEINLNQIDIVLDFGFLRNEQESMLSQFSKLMVNSLPFLNDYNKIILSLTAFPENLSGISGDSIEKIPRSEFKIWKNIISSKVKRKPEFGDYAIANPELFEMDPRTIRMSVNLRYTIANDWLILKGRDAKRFGYDQFYGLCDQLVNHSGEFYGEDFSWGDNEILEKSQQIGGTGNATTWRQIGTNHHLELVVDQLSSIPFDS
ncbi:Beta protein [Zunongwangia mangrovi]|uniref:Beta protein n=1 Tax=Zunongwangia mangrovi TaxID=1334022 RepID=A0A1I1DA01_9FLAO|nr:beta family protein [Zunongwangia mangrovi]SFB71647.1 Beta protein [Zunongwangia mangrovi]